LNTLIGFERLIKVLLSSTLLNKLLHIIFIFLIITYAISDEGEGERDGFQLSTISIEKLVFIDDLGRVMDRSRFNQLGLLQIEEVILDPQAMLEDVQVLKNKFPEYQSIVTRVDPIDHKSVTLTYEFQMSRKISAIRIISEDDDLAYPDNLRDKLSTFKGSIMDGRHIQTDLQMLKDEFMKFGYPNVQVTHKVEVLDDEDDSTDVVIRYDVIPGSKQTRVYQIRVHGNRQISKSDVIKAMKTEARNWFFESRPIFNLKTINDDLPLVEELYFANGMTDARVEYKWKIIEKGLVTVDIYITEGKQYQLKDIIFFGTQNFETEAVEEAFNFRKGSNYNGKRIRKGLQGLRELFGENGYAMVNSLSNYDGAKETLNVYVESGQKQYIADIVVEGNEKMSKELILRDVKMELGDQVNTELIRKTLRKMQNTKYYSDVKIDYNPTSETDGQVIIQVVEARTQSIQFGVGTNGQGIVGEFGYTNHNLFNTGKSISISAKKAEEMARLGLIYHDPHLFGSDLELHADAHYDQRQYADYDQRKVGSVIMIEKAISENLRIGVGTRIEFVDLDNIAAEIAEEVIDLDGKDRIIGMVSTIVYKNETYDAAGDVKDGFRARIALFPSYANNGVYLRAFTEAVGSKTFGVNEHGVGHTISGRITLGYASENAPFYEKFYAGGIGTIRGFDHRSIRPKGSAIGGNVSLSGGVTYSFPLWRDKIKGVAFLEAASVTNDFDGLGDVRVVGGLGVRANLRDTFLGGSLEAGFAIPLRKQNGDQLKPFYFMFGDYDPAYDL
jgi:outer membrane protein insertion porin family